MTVLSASLSKTVFGANVAESFNVIVFSPALKIQSLPLKNVSEDVLPITSVSLVVKPIITSLPSPSLY